MAYRLFDSQDKILFADKPLIKADNAKDIASTLDLLAAAKKIKEEAEADIAKSVAEGFASGQAQAKSELSEYIAEAVAPMIIEITENQASLRRDLAVMAYSAITQILGSLPDDEKMAALTKHALSRLEIEDIEAIELSAVVADNIQAKLSSDVGKLVRALDDVAIEHCTIRTTSGSILCSLDLQLQTLEKRWGVDAS